MKHARHDIRDLVQLAAKSPARDAQQLAGEFGNDIIGLYDMIDCLRQQLEQHPELSRQFIIDQLRLLVPSHGPLPDESPS